VEDGDLVTTGDRLLEDVAPDEPVPPISRSRMGDLIARATGATSISRAALSF
jgi:hypothetical protein